MQNEIQSSNFLSGVYLCWILKWENFITVHYSPPDSDPKSDLIETLFNDEVEYIPSVTPVHQTYQNNSSGIGVKIELI